MTRVLTTTVTLDSFIYKYIYMLMFIEITSGKHLMSIEMCPVFNIYFFATENPYQTDELVLLQRKAKEKEKKS